LGKFTVLDTALSVYFCQAALEADVPLGRDLVGGDEEAAHILRDFLEVPDGAGAGNVFHELGAENPRLLASSSK